MKKVTEYCKKVEGQDVLTGDHILAITAFGR